MHAPEVLHFFRTFARALGLFFSRYSGTLPGHVLHLVYLFWIFWTFNSSFICAHSPDVPEVPHVFLGSVLSTRAVVFRYSRHSQDMYYIWHIYFGYFRHEASHLFVHTPEVPHFLGHLPKHQGCFFSDILYTLGTCITFGIFISDISDIQQLIYLCTFSWCSRSSAFFFRTFTQAPVLFLSDIPDTPRTCITFGIFISDISDIKHLIYLCMLQKCRIFFRTYTRASGLFFSAFSHSSSTCLIFISHTLDIKPLIYLFTSCWSSGSSAFSKDTYLSTRVKLFSGIWHIPGTSITFCIFISDILGI